MTKLNIEQKISSKVGFGTWGFAGNVYGNIKENKAEELVKLSVNNGINFFDTSSLYGMGRSEKILGNATKGLREKVVFTTKGGLKFKSRFDEFQDFSEKYLNESLEKSLKNLNTNYIDIYLLHSPNLDAINDNVFKTLEKFKQNNLISEFGVSVKNPSDAKFFIQKYDVKIIETNFSLIDQRVKEYGVFDNFKGVKIISRTPLNYGFLTDNNFGKLEFNKQNDHRFRFGNEQLEIWNNAIDKFKKEFDNFKIYNKNLTRSQFSLNFCISHSQVLVAIPGMMREEEVLENAKTNNLDKFNEDLLNKLYEIYKKNIFFKKN